MQTKFHHLHPMATCLFLFRVPVPCLMLAGCKPLSSVLQWSKFCFHNRQSLKITTVISKTCLSVSKNDSSAVSLPLWGYTCSAGRADNLSFSEVYLVFRGSTIRFIVVERLKHTTKAMSFSFLCQRHSCWKWPCCHVLKVILSNCNQVQMLLEKREVPLLRYFLKSRGQILQIYRFILYIF